ncbi:hypothetical protein FDP41_003425 [Naegleria fowleri]|uniref:Probable imidazolonepropionase n=1 Tax=Naegleria fowleri TaxID=5763 RepID=A0A6A5BHU3_NAEFO|nr:uncharacterized protein FDP41_003425 [Naegleria fowleri]KAF0977433.1 hypothetical protein FDP41_003425 [Naegleria fowleri]CAG4713064.1 unnamed protein product [Naegleria fowleri]
MSSRFRTLITNATQLVCVSFNKNVTLLKGAEQNTIEIISNGAMIIGHDGNIAHLGTTQEIQQIISRMISSSNNNNNNENNTTCSLSDLFETILDCTGKSVIPGLVDSHTHPVWSGDRCHEFVLKLQGATYMDIHKMGGGIGFTVKHTRESSEEDLLNLLIQRGRKMLRNGTTLMEGKSGYGLETETEVKMLKVLHQANKKHVELGLPEIVSNYLGAHSVPKTTNLQDYTRQILEEQIPALAEMIEKDEIGPSLIDVFHEKGVFETEETRRVLSAGKEKLRLAINFHGDELNPMGSAELAYELDALAVSHCEHVSDKGIELMAEKNICATLLPTTAYILRIAYPPARKMIEKGVPVVLSTDFNPNAHCMSLPFVMNLSCVNMRMTLNEALVACTLNAAASIGKASTHGSLAVGKKGDCVIINHPNWEHLIYELCDSPILHVIMNGKVVYTNQQL